MSSAAIVTAHELATETGAEVLRKGGNAVDAAIAANAVLGVVAPETCGIGGDLFAIIHTPGDPIPAALNASGWAGSNVDPDKLLTQVGSMPLFGRDSVTVPGCVAGWSALHDRFGSMDMETLLRPAIEFAERGFKVSAELAGALSNRVDQLSGQAIAHELLPNGAPPPAGNLLRRPSLAATLKEIAQSGPTAFYRGQPASDIVEALEGRMTLQDLEDFEPEWVSPLSADLFGQTGWTIPPNSQGYITLAALAVMEPLERPHDEAGRWHQQIEAYRSVAWERNDVVSEPQHRPRPLSWYLDRGRLSERSEQIGSDSARVWPEHSEPPGGTTALSVWDGIGTGIVLIQSNFHGLGTTVGAGTSGFLLQNRGGSFTLEPGHPNQLRPRSRPLHTLSPTLWTDNGQLSMLLTTRGGHQQPQILSQIAAGILIDKRSAADMQQTYRWTTDAFEAGTSSHVLVEARTPDEVIEGLRSRGHVVEISRDHEPGWGPVALVTKGPNGPVAVADPRVATSSALHL